MVNVTIYGSTMDPMAWNLRESHGPMVITIAWDLQDPNGMVYPTR